MRRASLARVNVRSMHMNDSPALRLAVKYERTSPERTRSAIELKCHDSRFPKLLDANICWIDVWPCARRPSSRLKHRSKVTFNGLPPIEPP